MVQVCAQPLLILVLFTKAASKDGQLLTVVLLFCNTNRFLLGTGVIICIIAAPSDQGLMMLGTVQSCNKDTILGIKPKCRLWSVPTGSGLGSVSYR